MKTVFVSMLFSMQLRQKISQHRTYYCIQNNRQFHIQFNSSFIRTPNEKQNFIIKCLKRVYGREKNRLEWEVSKQTHLRRRGVQLDKQTVQVSK